AEGLEISAESKEGKMIHKIVDALEVFADAIVTLDEEQEELQDFVVVVLSYLLLLTLSLL
ncbi:CD1247 N-terminal domain-containing protein, partial [Clostridioides difficile]|uniref:CD1247 N-terminal domain-containing protein n=1 Tax=Clostridioides difficile TaxID=1496 RepID=UPI002ED24E1E